MQSGTTHITTIKTSEHEKNFQHFSEINTRKGKIFTDSQSTILEGKLQNFSKMSRFAFFALVQELSRKFPLPLNPPTEPANFRLPKSKILVTKSTVFFFISLKTS